MKNSKKEPNLKMLAEGYQAVNVVNSSREWGIGSMRLHLEGLAFSWAMVGDNLKNICENKNFEKIIFL